NSTTTINTKTYNYKNYKTHRPSFQRSSTKARLDLHQNLALDVRESPVPPSWGAKYIAGLYDYAVTTILLERPEQDNLLKKKVDVITDLVLEKAPGRELFYVLADYCEDKRRTPFCVSWLGKEDRQQKNDKMKEVSESTKSCPVLISLPVVYEGHIRFAAEVMLRLLRGIAFS
ncbi:unnamed protein product, partial [Amoebophrya sp. A25]